MYFPDDFNTLTVLFKISLIKSHASPSGGLIGKSVKSPKT